MMPCCCAYAAATVLITPLALPSPLFSPLRRLLHDCCRLSRFVAPYAHARLPHRCAADDAIFCRFIFAYAACHCSLIRHYAVCRRHFLYARLYALSIRCLRRRFRALRILLTRHLLPCRRRFRQCALHIYASRYFRCRFILLPRYVTPPLDYVAAAACLLIFMPP